MPKKIALIGGPATGKTTLIDALKAKGFSCMDEISRQITIEAQKKGVKQLFLEDPIWFSKHLLEARKNQFLVSQNFNEPLVFFDRGLPDVVAYLDYIKSVPLPSPSPKPLHCTRWSTSRFRNPGVRNLLLCMYSFFWG